MIAILTTHWNLLMFRGYVAVALGLLAFARPEPSREPLSSLFCMFALVNVLPAIVMAMASSRVPGASSLVLEGVTGITAAAVTVAHPAITATSLLVLIALWAIVAGFAAIAAAYTLRSELNTNWPLPLSAGLSI